MRHQKAGRKFSRTSEHRQAMFSNLVASLMLHERIETTQPKAKELKRLADRTIAWGTRVGDLLEKGRDKLSAEEKARIVHAMRMARRTCRHPEALKKLFGDVALRFRGRSGGYTRLLKTRVRVGDAAPMAWVELVERRVASGGTSEGAQAKGTKSAQAGASSGEGKTSKGKGETSKAKGKQKSED